MESLWKKNMETTGKRWATHLQAKKMKRWISKLLSAVKKGVFHPANEPSRCYQKSSLQFSTSHEANPFFSTIFLTQIIYTLVSKKQKRSTKCGLSPNIVKCMISFDQSSTKHSPTPAAVPSWTSKKKTTK